MARARAHACPGALGALSKAMPWGEQKLEDGKRLINKFCIPRKDIPHQYFALSFKEPLNFYLGIIISCRRAMPARALVAPPPKRLMVTPAMTVQLSSWSWYWFCVYSSFDHLTSALIILGDSRPRSSFQTLTLRTRSRSHALRRLVHLFDRPGGARTVARDTAFDERTFSRGKCSEIFKSILQLQLVNEMRFVNCQSGK